jgi:PAS domain S-box-containing protein
MISETSASWIKHVALALACAAAILFIHPFALTLTVPAAAWLPAGIALGAMIVLGPRLWPGALVGWAAAAAATGLPPLAAVLSAMAGTAGAAAGAALFRRVGADPTLERFRDVGWMLLGAVPVAATVTAVAGYLALRVTGLPPVAQGAGAGLPGYAVCALYSVLGFAPLAMGVSLRQRLAATARKWAELGAIAAIRAATTLLTAMATPYPVQLAMVVFNFPLLAWTALRFNLLVVGLLLSFTLFWGMAATTMGLGPLQDFGAVERWVPLTGFTVLATVMALLAHAAMSAARRLQRDLIASEQRLHDIAESASDFFWETDEKGRLLYVSERFTEFVGSETEVLLGRLGFEDALSELRAGDWPEVTDSIRRRRAYRNLRVPVTIMTGEQRVLQVSGKPVFEADGTFRGYRGACSDITEQLAAADALFQAQKMETVGQLTGGLAHDFNNLLAVIIGNMELSEEAVRDDAPTRAMVRKAIDAAERGALLIQRLLAFSRRQALSPRMVDVAEQITGLEDILRQAAGDGVAVRTDLEAGLWQIRVDPTQLEAALLNMALNSRDAMNGSGRLEIVARNVAVGDDARGRDPLMPGDYVSLAVTDTGEGMSEETLAHIFEPFFTTKETGRGSGLGLSMVYGFVRQSGGGIDAASTPGKGTTITLFLPRHQETQADTRDGVAAEPLSGAGEHILLVEDDPDVRDLMARRLQLLGYDVTVAEDGHRALGMLPQQRDIDLLLTDIVLPGGLYGDNLAQQARALRPGLKVLFMSGYPKTARDRMADDNAAILRKPFRNQELAQALHRALHEAAPRGNA